MKTHYNWMVEFDKGWIHLNADNQQSALDGAIKIAMEIFQDKSKAAITPIKAVEISN